VSTDRFERDLPDLLTQLEPSAVPDYRDDIVRQTARMRQRPAWMFPEWWLPMSVLTTRAVAAPPIRWRVVGTVALLLLALVVGLMIVAGSQRHIPAPFGPAANGLVAYEKGGDIFTADPMTGVSTAVITGTERDINPRWSRDGTRLAFERKGDSDSGPGVLYVARADGSHMVQLKTAATFAQIDGYEFSPDGKELLITYKSGWSPAFLIAATDGSGFRTLPVARLAGYAAWRPPDGSEILLMDVDDGQHPCCGIYAINAETGSIRDILAIEPGRLRSYPRWSPDGSLISFAEWVPADGLTVQTHIIAADGTGDRILPSPPGTVWQGTESWSNDGTRMLVVRGYAPDEAGARPVAIPVDGHDTGVEIEWLSTVMSPTDPWAWEWAPDDSLILGAPTNERGAYGDQVLLGPVDQVLLDPVAGTSRTLPWSSVSLPSWQRITP
jgi:dipeptidyl aminopeptidase/acylaminoacyl peptidase